MFFYALSFRVLRPKYNEVFADSNNIEKLKKREILICL